MAKKPAGRVPKCVCGGTRGMGFMFCRPCWRHLPLAQRQPLQQRRDYGSPERRAKYREAIRWLKANPKPTA